MGYEDYKQLMGEIRNTIDDYLRAFKVMSRFADILKAAGKSY